MATRMTLRRRSSLTNCLRRAAGMHHCIGKPSQDDGPLLFAWLGISLRHARTINPETNRAQLVGWHCPDARIDGSALAGLDHLAHLHGFSLPRDVSLRIDEHRRCL